MFTLILVLATAAIIWTIVCTVCATDEARTFGASFARTLVRNIFTAQCFR